MLSVNNYKHFIIFIMFLFILKDRNDVSHPVILQVHTKYADNFINLLALSSR